MAQPSQQPTNKQPTGTGTSMEMRPAGTPNNNQKEAPANRLRGGGAAKDCFLAIFGCFLCCECCEGCCDCIGDIICCPCEMCC